MATVNLVPTIYFNIKQYGAVGDGSNDDTSAINNAIAAAAGGGYVYFPPGIYNTTGSIIINNDNIVLKGAGWSSVIKPASGAQFDAISTPIPGSAGLAGFVRNYIGVCDLKVDCSSMTGSTAGQGNGIHWYGVRYGSIKNVLVLSCPNWAILLDGDNSGAINFGYNNQIVSCTTDLCNASILTTNCEANDIVECIFKWAGTATAALQPVFGTQATTARHAKMTSGYANIVGCVFGNGGTYTTSALRFENGGPSRVYGNRFDQCRYQAIETPSGNQIIVGNQFGNCSSVGTVQVISIGSSNNIITGNKFDITNGAAHYTYCIQESGGPYSGNVIEDNNFVAGTSGVVNQNATSTNSIAHNPGYNPVGFAVTQPAVPASTVNATNNSGVDCTVYISGGTLTVVNVGGSATGITAAAAAGSVHAVDVPANQTISITYTVAPTWKWFGR